MKTIQIQYQTKEGTYLCDINYFIAISDSRIYKILNERYGVVYDWEIVKIYNLDAGN